MLSDSSLTAERQLQDDYDVMFDQQHVAQLRTVGDLAAVVHSRPDPPPT